MIQDRYHLQDRTVAGSFADPGPWKDRFDAVRGAVSVPESKGTMGLGREKGKKMQRDGIVLTVAVLLGIGLLMAFGCGQYQASAPPLPVQLTQ